MLQAIRQRLTGWIAVVAVLAIGIPFAFFGVGDFFMGRNTDVVAKVGDSEISGQAFRERFNRYREQMLRQFEGQIDASFFDQPELRREILDGLIEEEMLLQVGRAAGLVIPAQRIREEIADVPAFQVEGRFNPEVYRQVLAANRTTPALFERDVARDLEARELQRRLSQTALVTSADVDAFVALRQQQRDFAYLRLASPPVDADWQPEESEILDYHARNSDRFMTMEQVEVEYIELSADAIEVDVEIEESELRQRYQSQIARFGTPEERLVSHILIPVGPEGDAEAHRAALEKVESLLARLREGADFTELAREHSADPGSARDGGDLGWLSAGLTDPAFDEALFAMKEPGYSEPVLSSEGFHLIWLREIRGGDVRPFEEVREELAREMIEPERERRFIEQQGRMFELIFEDPSALEPIADAMGLEIRRSGLFGRGGGPGIASHREVVRQAFSDLVLLQGATSDPIEIGPGRAVAIRVLEHRPSVLRPVDEVREQIVAALREQRRLDAARSAAEALLARFQAGEDLEALAAELETEVQPAEGTARFTAAHDSRLVAEVFRLPRPDRHGEQRALVDLGAGSFALVRLYGVQDGTPSTLSASERAQFADQLRTGRGQLDVEAFVAAVRQRFRPQVFEDRLQ